MASFNDGVVDASPYALYWQMCHGNMGDLLFADLCQMAHSLDVFGNMFNATPGRVLFPSGHSMRPSIVVRLGGLTYSSALHNADTWEVEWESEPMTMRDLVDDIRDAAGMPAFAWAHTPRMSDLDTSRGTFPINPAMLIEIKQAMGRFCSDGDIYERFIEVGFRSSMGPSGENYVRGLSIRQRTDTTGYVRLAMGTGFRRHPIYDSPGSTPFGHVAGFCFATITDSLSRSPIDAEYDAPETDAITGLSYGTGNEFPWAMADDYLRYRCAAADEDRSECNVYDWRGADMVGGESVWTISAAPYDRFSDSTESVFVDEPFTSADDPSGILETYSEDEAEFSEEPGFNQHLLFAPRRVHVITQPYARSGDKTLRFHNEPHIGRLEKLYPDAWYRPYPG